MVFIYRNMIYGCFEFYDTLHTSHLTAVSQQPLRCVFFGRTPNGQAYEPQSVNDVMVHHAKDLVDQNNMQVGGENGKLDRVIARVSSYDRIFYPEISSCMLLSFLESAVDPIYRNICTDI